MQNCRWRGRMPPACAWCAASWRHSGGRWKRRGRSRWVAGWVGRWACAWQSGGRRRVCLLFKAGKATSSTGHQTTSLFTSWLTTHSNHLLWCSPPVPWLQRDEVQRQVASTTKKAAAVVDSMLQVQCLPGSQPRCLPPALHGPSVTCPTSSHARLCLPGSPGCAKAKAFFLLSSCCLPAPRCSPGLPLPLRCSASRITPLPAAVQCGGYRLLPVWKPPGQGAASGEEARGRAGRWGWGRGCAAPVAGWVAGRCMAATCHRHAAIRNDICRTPALCVHAWPPSSLCFLPCPADDTTS